MLKIFPPIWFFLFLTLGLIVHFVFPGARVFDLSGWPYVSGGILLFMFGMGLSMQASKLFAEEKTEILPTSQTNRILVTRGPYRWTRNPMYLGMVVTLLGIGLFVGTLPVLITAFCHFLVMNFVFIPFEENKLLRVFGEQYEAYKRTVRRWI